MTEENKIKPKGQIGPCRILHHEVAPYKKEAGVQIPGKTDHFESSNASIDYSSDGKFSFSEAIKNFGKGLLSPITALTEIFKSATGFLFGAVMIGGGIALAAFLPVTIPIMLVVGGAFSLFELGKGALKFITSAVKGDGDGMEHAFKDIGAGTVGTVLTLLGVKGTVAIAAEAKAAGAAIRAGLTETEAVEKGLNAAAKSMSLPEAFKADLSLFSKDGIVAIKSGRRLAKAKKELFKSTIEKETKIEMERIKKEAGASADWANQIQTRKPELRKSPDCSMPSVRNKIPDRLIIQIPGFKRDMRWTLNMENVTDHAVANIDEFRSVKDLIAFIAENYKNYFLLLQKEFSENPFRAFSDLLRTTAMATAGTNRTFLDHYRTPINSLVPRYRGYRLRAMELVNQGLKDKSTITEKFKTGKFLVREDIVRTHTTKGIIDNEVINLTRTNTVNDKKVIWIHTSPNNVLKILKHVDKLYKEVMMTRTAIELGAIPRNQQTFDKVVKLTAEIQWWFSHAMPYRRGSAGIGDILKNVILDSLGINAGRWRRNLGPDLEALVTPLDDYINNYPTFFEEPLHWLDTATKSIGQQLAIAG